MSKELATAEKTTITQKVLDKVNGLLATGKTSLPPGYDHPAALEEAWLALQTVQDLNKKNIIVDGKLSGVVTPVSVMNALNDMLVQGLRVGRKQCYFIVYGNVLTCQRSVYGDMALASRVLPGHDIKWHCVKEGEEEDGSFDMDIVNGKLVVVKHKPKLSAMNRNTVAIYATLFDKAGKPITTELMTTERIEKSWMMSKVYASNPKNPNATHNKFPDDMGARTVIRYLLKPYINSAIDGVLLESVRRQDFDGFAGDSDNIIDMESNSVPLPLPENVAPVDTPEDKPVASAPVATPKPEVKTESVSANPVAEVQNVAQTEVNIDDEDLFDDEGI